MSNCFQLFFSPPQESPPSYKDSALKFPQTSPNPASTAQRYLVFYFHSRTSTSLSIHHIPSLSSTSYSKTSCRWLAPLVDEISMFLHICCSKTAPLGKLFLFRQSSVLLSTWNVLETPFSCDLRTSSYSFLEAHFSFRADSASRRSLDDLLADHLFSSPHFDAGPFAFRQHFATVHRNIKLSSCQAPNRTQPVQFSCLNLVLGVFSADN